MRGILVLSFALTTALVSSHAFAAGEAKPGAPVVQKADPVLVKPTGSRQIVVETPDAGPGKGAIEFAPPPGPPPVVPAPPKLEAPEAPEAPPAVKAEGPAGPPPVVADEAPEPKVADKPVDAQDLIAADTAIAKAEAPAQVEAPAKVEVPVVKVITPKPKKTHKVYQDEASYSGGYDDNEQAGYGDGCE